MKHKTEEFIAILLAIVILVAVSIVIDPSITGYIIHEFSDFTHNNDITTENNIQLKQHSYLTNSSEQTSYYFLTFAEENDKTKLIELESMDDKFVEIDIIDILKIKFDNNLQDQDKINLFLTNENIGRLDFCTFNANISCANQTIYATYDYQGIEGFYQIPLNLPETQEGISIYSADNKIKIDYINASYQETTSTNITYYNSAELETETIQPENLSAWDLFTADYILNNQTITFYYTTNTNYIEFTPPYNFSLINSSALKFKLALFSDNSSTPIIHNLSINYIEFTQQEENTTEPPETPTPPPSSPGKPSSTRHKSSPPTTTTTVTATAPVETHTITQAVEPLKEISGEVIEQEITKPPFKLYINLSLFSLLTILSYIYYHKRCKKPL